MSRADGAAPYPVLLDLDGRHAVVVGGDARAAGLAADLLAHGARVRVIAPAFAPALEHAIARGECACERRGYVRGDLAGAFLAVLAEDEAEVAAAVRAEAAREGALLYAIGDPDAGDFVPAEGAIVVGTPADSEES